MFWDLKPRTIVETDQLVTPISSSILKEEAEGLTFMNTCIVIQL